MFRDARVLKSQVELAKDIKETYAFFGSGFEDPVLNRVHAAAQAALGGIADATMAFLSDPAKPVLLHAASAAVVKEGLPGLRWLNDYGSGAGMDDRCDYFVDPVVTSAVPRRLRVSKIELSGLNEAAVKWTRTTYASDTTEYAAEHGNPAQSCSHLLELVQGDYINATPSTYSQLHSVRVVTTNGVQITAGQSRQPGDTLLRLPPHSDGHPAGVIIGFAGRAAVDVDRIIVVTMRFLPCSWQDVL